eukprot:UN11255
MRINHEALHSYTHLGVSHLHCRQHLLELNLDYDHSSIRYPLRHTDLCPREISGIFWPLGGHLIFTQGMI